MHKGILNSQNKSPAKGRGDNPSELGVAKLGRLAINVWFENLPHFSILHYTPKYNRDIIVYIIIQCIVQIGVPCSPQNSL